MSVSSRLTAFKRWLWLINRRRLHKRELSRQISYQAWCAKYDALDDATLAAMRVRLAGLPAQPLVALQLHLGGASTEALAITLASLGEQLYIHWQLELINDSAAPEPAVMAWAQSATAADARVSLSSALEPAAWVARVHPGDTWRPHALLLLMEAALQRPHAQLIYADHDSGDAGHRHTPAFKCDWNAELLWSHDYLGAPVLWQALRWTQQGLHTEMSDHARALRGSSGLTSEQVLHVPHVLVHRVGADRQEDAAAVKRHLQQLGHEVEVESSAQACGIQLRFALPTPPPRVSIIIPTRNGLDLLRTCITSLLQKTDYANFDITVVDNGSDDAACMAYLQDIAQQPQIKVLRDDRPFNYAQLNNGAAQQCSGDFVALLNNDIEVIDRGWLREMVSLAALPGVGAVGARLLYGDRTVQHAGVILGIGGGAGHVHKRLGEMDGGYLGRGLQLQSLSAVTAACLLVRRDHYVAVGGLDAESFAVAFNDIDFCLRLRATGLRNLYTPHAVLLHHESVSRGKDNSADKRPRFEAERDRFVQRWGPLLNHDPAYNPNLTLQAESFGLADPPRVSLLKPWFETTAIHAEQHAHPPL
jgi:O-antigen biosynthesis protein